MMVMVDYRDILDWVTYWIRELDSGYWLLVETIFLPAGSVLSDYSEPELKYCTH